MGSSFLFSFQLLIFTLKSKHYLPMRNSRERKDTGTKPKGDRIEGRKWGWLGWGGIGRGKWRQLYLNNNFFLILNKKINMHSFCICEKENKSFQQLQRKNVFSLSKYLERGRLTVWISVELRRLTVHRTFSVDTGAVLRKLRWLVSLPEPYTVLSGYRDYLTMVQGYDPEKNQFAHHRITDFVSLQRLKKSIPLILQMKELRKPPKREAA